MSLAMTIFSMIASWMAIAIAMLWGNVADRAPTSSDRGLHP